MTPLHYACVYNRDEIALFLIREEQERVTRERQEGQDGQPRRRGEGQQQHDTSSYNMRNEYVLSPVFYTSSSAIVEEMLKFDDLQVTTENGKQLLWQCARWGCVSKRVASDPKLAGQYGQRWEG